MSQDTVFVILVMLVIAVLFLFREKDMTPVIQQPAAVGEKEEPGVTFSYYNINQPFSRNLTGGMVQ